MKNNKDGMVKPFTINIYWYYVLGKSILIIIPIGTDNSHRQSVARETLPGKPGLVTEPRVLNTAPPHPGPDANTFFNNIVIRIRGVMNSLNEILKSEQNPTKDESIILM